MASTNTAPTRKDPVCGMDVNPERAAGQYEYHGQVYYFCHPRCLEKFRAAPAAWRAEQTAAALLAAWRWVSA